MHHDRRRPPPVARRRILGWALTLVLVVAIAAHAAPPAVARSTSTGVPAGFEPTIAERVSPGVEHWAYRRDLPAQRVHVARIAPDASHRLVPMLSGDAVGSVPRYERTSAMCARVHCVVAINGDFIDVASTMPVGGMILDGQLVATPRIDHGHLLVHGESGPSIGHRFDWSVLFETRVSTPLAVAAVNQPPGPDGTTLYTTRWGAATPSGDDVLDLVLARVPQPQGQPTGAEQAMVIEELRSGGGTPLTASQVVISGRGRGAALLDEIWSTGESADDRLADLTIEWEDAEWAIGGSPVLLQGGAPTPLDSPGDFMQGRHPRTAVGWTAAGEMLLVTVDGRQPGYSVGMTLRELAELLVALGAVEALNLDGGGSTTFVVDSRVVNRPSDGSGERSVATALVVGVPEGRVAVPWQRPDSGSCPAERVPDARFTDIDGGNLHRRPVDCLVWWQVANGVAPRRFGPDRSVTRGQMASFLARVVEQTDGSLPPDGPGYRDLAGSPHEVNIRRLAAAGIVTGRPDGTYGPSDPVTRGQMATMLVRTIELRSGARLDALADYFGDDGRSVHQAAVNAAAGAGIAGGDGSGRFLPALDVRRDQMASFLTRTLDHLVALGLAQPPG